MILRESDQGSRRVLLRGLARLSLGVGILALPLASCDDSSFGPGDDMTLSEPFAFPGNASAFTRLRVTNVNGEILVTGASASDTYQVIGVRRVSSCTRSQAEARLEDLEVQVTSVAAGLVVAADYPQSTTPCNVGVDFEITVPSGLVVDVTHVNGAITISDFQNGVSVISVNGQVPRRHRGRLVCTAGQRGDRCGRRDGRR